MKIPKNQNCFYWAALHFFTQYTIFALYTLSNTSIRVQTFRIKHNLGHVCTLYIIFALCTVIGTIFTLWKFYRLLNSFRHNFLDCVHFHTRFVQDVYFPNVFKDWTTSILLKLCFFSHKNPTTEQNKSTYSITVVLFLFAIVWW